MLIKEYLSGILSIFNHWCREVRKHPCWVNFPHEWNLVSMLNYFLEFELKLLKFHIASDSEIVAQWTVPVIHASKIKGLPGKKLCICEAPVLKVMVWENAILNMEILCKINRCTGYSFISLIFQVGFFLFCQQPVLNSTKPVKNRNKYLIYYTYQLYKIGLWNIQVPFKRLQVGTLVINPVL